jgi:hypothetical protein
MRGHIFRLLALCAVVATPAAGQNAQEPIEPEPPPPVFELIPETYIQFDWRAYPEYPVEPGTGRLEFDTFEVRRVRVGATGQWRGARFEFTVDPQDIDGTLVKDAYVEFRPGSYEVRFGQFKPPSSRDYGTSARQTDFLERTGLGGSLSAQRDLGAALHGDIGQHVDYDVGVFAGDNNGAPSRSGLTGTGRLEWEPQTDLVLALYGSEGRLTALETDPENGLEGRLSSGYRFFENVYVQGRRTRVGGDVEWSPGPLQFTVETLRVRDERREQGVDVDDLPALVGLAANFTTRWRFAPRRDVVVRYEYLGFDDVGADTAMASVRPRAADVRARAGQAVTLGGSWNVTRWLRFMGHAGVDWFSDPRTAPEAGDDRGYWTFGTRLQLELPDILGLRVR